MLRIGWITVICLGISSSNPDNVLGQVNQTRLRSSRVQNCSEQLLNKLVASSKLSFVGETCCLPSAYNFITHPNVKTVRKL